VLNAFNPLCYSAGGFRTWWRRLWNGWGEQPDDAHLMRREWPRVHSQAPSQGKAPEDDLWRESPPPSRSEGIAVETRKYDLTIFKLHFGKLTLKGYTKTPGSI